MTRTSAVTVETQEHPPSPPATEGFVVLNTRFGVIEADPSQAIRMPRGVLGFSDNHRYVLTALPGPAAAQFSLLQSLDDANVSFIVLPYEASSGVIDVEDLETARAALAIRPENLAVVLIVSIRKIGPVTEVAVNLRAPILLDAGNRSGSQFVLPNGKYPVRHVVSRTNTAG